MPLNSVCVFSHRHHQDTNIAYTDSDTRLASLPSRASLSSEPPSLQSPLFLWPLFFLGVSKPLGAVPAAVVPRP